MELFDIILAKSLVGGKTHPPVLITKTITENNTYLASDDDADGYSSVIVNVSGGGNYDVTGTVVDDGYDPYLYVDVHIPEGITSVPEYYYPRSLTLPSTVDYLYIPAYTSELISIDASNAAITEIPSNCFYDCSRLETVLLPSTVTSIEEDAFARCTSLASLDLSSIEIDTIGANAFAHCTSLASLDLSSATISTIEQNTFYSCSSLESITLPSTITEIGAEAFENCGSLTSLDLSSTELETIGRAAFYSCSSLASLDLSSTELETIGSSAFSNCSSLESITFPSTITDIGFDTFHNCTSLASLDLSSTEIDTVSSYVFSNCSSLESIILPNTITEIGDNAFEGCSKLENINFSDLSYLQSIYGSAFMNCTSLVSVDIPNSITLFGTLVFAGCSSLASFTCRATVPPQIDNYYGGVFRNTSPDLVIYVPAESVDTYKAAEGWRDYKSRIQAIPET